MKTKINALIKFLTASAIICFIAACAFFCLPLITKSNLSYAADVQLTKVVATELEYKDVGGYYARSDAADDLGGTGSFGEKGLIVYTTTNKDIGVGSTLTIPADVTSPVTVKMDIGIRKMDKWSTSRGELRLVLNNQVIYPTDGTWLDIYTVTSGGTEYVKFMTDLPAFSMKAGDNLHFIFRDANGINNYGNYYCTFGMTLNGTWFDPTVADHLDPANDSVTTSNYFGGTYAYSAFWNYNEYTWTDVGDTADLAVSGYESTSIDDGAAQTAASKRYYVYGNKNGTGAEYIVYNVTNTSSSASYLETDIYEGPNVSNFGQAWTIAGNTRYYAMDINLLETTVNYTSENGSSNHYSGRIPVPAGFDGKIYVPMDSFNQIGWQFNRNMQTKFGEMNEIYLAEDFVDVRLGAVDGMSVNSVSFLGADLEIVADTANTAISLIRKIGTVNAGSAALIAKARAVYNGLGDAQANVTNYQTLVDAEAAFAALSVDNSSIGSHGKDFTGSEGISLASAYTASPTTISAWIKVDKSVDDRTHVGTIIGNREMASRSQSMFDKSGVFSVEIPTNGNPKFIWKVSQTAKLYWTVDNVDVRTGEWLNLAFARDVANRSVYCYVNGVLVSSIKTEADFLGDIAFIKPAMIGSDYTNDKTLAYGYTPDFNGSIADLKVYSDLLAENEIVTNLNGVAAGKNLLTFVKFSSGEVGQYFDSATGETVVDAFAYKDVDVSDLKLGDYSMVVFGDTQMYLSVAKDGNGKNLYAEDYDYTTNKFYKNVQYVINNKDALNVKFLMHMGDLTDNLNNTGTTSSGTRKGYIEMDYGMQFMDMLTEAGIPWSLNRGNHDTDAYFDTMYGVEAYSSLASGYYEDMHNAYYKFEANGLKYMVVTLDLIPTAAERAWANEIISANPDHLVILTTHAYQKANGSYLTDTMSQGDCTGQVLWDEVVSQHKNVFMVLSGHSSGTDIVRNTATGANGNLVHQVMIDESQLNYFMYDQAQAGVFSILGFENGGNTIHFNFFSAGLNQTYRSVNQFTLNINVKDYLAADAFDSYEGDDAETVKAEYAAYLAGIGVSKDKLVEVSAPVVHAFEATTSGTYGKIYPYADFASMSVNTNCIVFTDAATGQSKYPVIALDVDKDGVFKFADGAKIKNNGGAWLHFAAVVIDGATNVTKRLYPVESVTSASFSSGAYGVVKNGSMYEYLVKGAQTVDLSTLDGVNVQKGDKILFWVRAGSTSPNVYIKATITDLNGTVNNYDAISTIMNTAGTYSILQQIYNCGFGNYDEQGNPINYNGWTIGYMNAVSTSSFTPYPYTLTVNDMNGTQLSANLVGIEAVVPALERAGSVFLGYNVGGVLYPVGSTVSLSASTTATAVFVEISTLGSAGIRIDALGSGLKFSTFVNVAKAELEALGATVSYGTLIAKAEEITVAGVKDYSLLTKDLTGSVIDLASTVQVSFGDYTMINGSLVGFRPTQYNLEIVARGYMTVTYADGTEAVFYAGVADNGRTVAEIAQKALNDISAVKTEEYKYEVSGGYSCFDQATREIFEGIIG